VTANKFDGKRMERRTVAQCGKDMVKVFSSHIRILSRQARFVSKLNEYRNYSSAPMYPSFSKRI
jgi:hypothetical protein